DHPEERRGEPERLLPAAPLEQFGEHRHERRREGGVGEQVADQVRDLEGDRERRDRPLRPEEARRDDFAPEPEHPGESGAEGEDRRVARYPPAPASQARISLLADFRRALGLSQTAEFLSEARVRDADDLARTIRSRTSGWLFGS